MASPYWINNHLDKVVDENCRLQLDNVLVVW